MNDAATPGYCIHCGSHNDKHTLACPKVMSGHREMPKLMMVAGDDATTERLREAMTEKDAKEHEYAVTAGKINIRQFAYARAVERNWAAVEGTDTKPTMAQILIEADMVYKWMFDGVVPQQMTFTTPDYKGKAN